MKSQEAAVRVAQEQLWRELKEAYVQPWTSFICDDDEHTYFN